MGFLIDVGLDYLALDRSAETLSSGEGQRIRLATQIGAALGAALLPAISAAVSNDAVTTTARGTRAAMLAAAIAAAVAALIAWRGAKAARVRPAALTMRKPAPQPAQAQPVAVAQPFAAPPVDDQSPAIRVTTGHDINHAPQYRTSALRRRLWDQLAVRHGFAARRPNSGGNGHCLVNKSGRDAVYLEVGTRSKHEQVEYPGADLMMIRDDKGMRYTHKNGEPYK